ncbi:aminotransferase class III-fold pyridoxal phosphate-dependent enzyme [Sinomonas sp. ASV322]|uniref:aspartate aminotransferase family protein n=1 Tax=Sinomonas sp. ASV322 TaxID=3041920 RepID=UPI0027DCB53A|nr:aminotransferase class III-fold pyridoxal phosphate-dependent enzyme [Sinomonas sp. ASV322]MDQ4504246.1 aminotransferase class III-fold pyridoxal phosphate-dependent enzyme [Sinomonas sp. ASV322]
MADLLERRYKTLGPYSPLFYAQPLEFVRAERVWLTAADGQRYLDGYNNVPHVGHTHPRVVEAIAQQAATLNIHTRYLNNRVVDYAESLLATLDDPIDRIIFTNSGSESNDLALRIANQHSGGRGLLISDFSYHGHTHALALATTGLVAHEGLGAHVRPIRIPDLDAADAGRPAADVLAQSLAEVDAAIASLQEAGHGVAAVLFDSLFSTEGLNRVPEGYVAGLSSRVRAAGGLVIGDEVQSGFGRTGRSFWGHQNHGIVPDLVTMGKPMGNGHPIGAVALSADLLDEFGPRNMYFNTFGGNPVSAAAGQAVLDVLADERLVERAASGAAGIRAALEGFRGDYPWIGPAKGEGLFFGFDVYDRPVGEAGAVPDPARTKAIVESMRARNVLISRIGRTDSVLKMRPPLAIEPGEVSLLLDTLADSLAAVGAVARA